MRTIHIYDDFSICYFTVSERGNEIEFECLVFLIFIYCNNDILSLIIKSGNKRYQYLYDLLYDTPLTLIHLNLIQFSI